MLHSIWLIVVLLFAGPAAHGVEAERRIGQTVWARPALTERSVDVYAEVALRTRIPLSEATPLRIERVVFGGPWPYRDPIYQVRLPDGADAYVAVGDFETRLYHELRPNEVAISPSYSPPLGRGIQVTLFERSSFFESDPRLMEARVMNQGPRTFVPAPSAGRRGAAGGGATVTTRKIDPVDAVIRPR